MTGTRGLEAISETEKQSLEDPPTHLADILLDRVFNPAGDPELARATPDQLLEACGLIPHFFCDACQQAEAENPDGFTLDNIADAMDNVCQAGGFRYHWPGQVAANGVYTSAYAEDPPLSPLMRFTFHCFDNVRSIECFVYKSGITCIKERGSAGSDGIFLTG
jgi:hypothetical protein